MSSSAEMIRGHVHGGKDAVTLPYGKDAVTLPYRGDDAHLQPL
jgi:hypothetical protein